MGKVAWTDFPVDLVDLLANRNSSEIDLLRIRSICKPWRSRVAAKKRVRSHFQRNLPIFKEKKTIVCPNTFFRVTLSSLCPTKGWLIKHRQVFKFSKNRLLSPLSDQAETASYKTLDLLKFGVSEIRQSYNVKYMDKDATHDKNSSRVVFLDNLFFVVDYLNMIWYCKSGEESGYWTRINNEKVEGFLDIILHRGNIYALDLEGRIWWISLSELNMYQYRPSSPEDDDVDDINRCKKKRLIEYCGDLCILHRFCEKPREKLQRTVGFKVYKMDEDLVKWVEVSSMGDKTLIVATDSCFTVLASEYYGCLESAIYFSDGENYESVFKLDDGSIITKQSDSSYSFSYHSCFQMFSTHFLSL